MPRYNPNTQNENANIPVFEADTYEFVIKSVKPRLQKKEVEGKQIFTHALTVHLEVTSRGTMQGKKLPLFFSFAENTIAFWKRFAMAAYDYANNSDAEEVYNEEILGNKDEGLEVSESGEVLYLGSLYKDLVNRRVIGDATVTYYKKNPADPGEGKKQNQWSWRGISSAIPSPETASV